MSRVQLAINVENLDEAIDFYSRLFDAVPGKVKPGYANFAIDEPPLKLVLFENQGKGGSINHLGVEVQTTEEVLTAEDRLGYVKHADSEQFENVVIDPNQSKRKCCD